MSKENVFPTRRSLVPTLSTNKSCIYLNVHFKNEYYPNDEKFHAGITKKGKSFFLVVAPKPFNGSRKFHSYSPGFTCNEVEFFQELKAKDIVRYSVEPVKTTLKVKGVKVFKLTPYAIDAVKEVNYFDFKLKI
jgi:hypothetical protein